MNILLMALAKRAGIDWRGLAEAELRKQLRNYVNRKWSAAAARIAKKMTAQHWFYGSVTSTRPTPPAAFLADIQFRLWKEVIPLGDLADVVRDAHDDKVLEAVRLEISPETPIGEVISLVIQAELDLTW